MVLDHYMLVRMQDTTTGSEKIYTSNNMYKRMQNTYYNK